MLLLPYHLSAEYIFNVLYQWILDIIITLLFTPLLLHLDTD